MGTLRALPHPDAYHIHIHNGASIGIPVRVHMDSMGTFLAVDCRTWGDTKHGVGKDNQHYGNIRDGIDQLLIIQYTVQVNSIRTN